MKEVTFDQEALDKLLTGIATVAKAVGKTIGPCGTNVFIDHPTTPKFTNDGASIAHQIILADKLENAGAWVARNACSQTNDDAGDGTTTTVVLLKAIIDECLKRPENKTLVMQSLMEAKDKVLKELKKQAKPITQKEVINVARISAENEELAQLVTEVVGKVGEKAVITVEDRTDGFESDYKLVQGYEAHVGFMSPYFRNDPVKPRALYSDIRVLCSAKRMGTVNDLKFFEKLAQEGINELVIVGEEIEPSILGIFVATKMSGKMNLLVIKAQGPLLEDIAAATGATVISDETGVTFENLDVKKHLGLANKVICEEKKTVFMSGATSAKRQADRLTEFAANNPNQFEAKKLRERAAKLKGGIAVIRIGAHTDAERNYLKDKAEDTIHACQSALEEGVVEGGGIALYRIAEKLTGNSVGEHILRHSLTSPFRQIIENAGEDYAQKVKNLPEGQGYDARRGKYCDFLKEGILDPAKVERCAVENAVSTAALFITTHCAIVDHVEEKSS
jgi:chaperonin GroEL